jgi:hypothetical protein
MPPRPCPLVIVLPILLAAATAAADDRLEDRGHYRPSYFAEFLDVEIAGDRAHVLGVGGLAILDVSDPDLPVLLGHHAPPTGERYYRGSVAGDHVYCGAREAGLVVVDATAVSEPVEVARVAPAGTSYEGSTVADGVLYACRHAAGLHILDVTDPSAPATLATFTDLQNAWDVVVADGTAYVADGLGGLAILDVSQPGAPQLLARVATEGAATDVAVAGSLAAVALGSAGVALHDVADPASSELLAAYDTPGLAMTLDLAGDRLFVADWDQVEVIDVSVPSAPAPAGRENTPVRAMGLAARDGRVFVADWSRLRIYDHGPTTRGDIELPTWFDFGWAPLGAVVDTVLTVGNTGGGTLTVTDIAVFADAFELTPPVAFTVPPGESRDVPVRYRNDALGEDLTFMRVESDDTDEGEVTFPVSGEPDPDALGVGDPAPPFTLEDLGGVEHSLTQYRGRVVVLAFFANW